MFELSNFPSCTASQAKRYGLRASAFFGMLLLTACGTWIHDDIPDGVLDGVVDVQWDSEDLFVYRRLKSDPLWFKPASWPKGTRIEPTDMYTDGGSVPRVFWNLPGLSPWGFGPAYIIHDYIFAVHRCGWNDPLVQQIKFEESAEILAEVGKALIERKLIKHDALDAIVWAVRTQYARTLWDTPGNAEDCKPAPPRPFRGAPVVQIVKFKIPPVAR
jgi:hypothetical protein